MPESDVPAAPRRVGDRRADAVGDRRRIPDRADPRRIRVARAVNHDSARRDHRAHVSGRVAGVNDVGGRPVDADVGDVVDRRRRRDRVDHRRHRGGRGPRPVGIARDEPHRVLQRVVRGRRHPDHRNRGVLRIAERGVLDRHELRRTVVLDVERGLAALDGGGLRHAVRDQRFARRAPCLPPTPARPPSDAAGESARKSGGSAFEATKVHGPFRVGALNQRPVRRT